MEQRKLETTEQIMEYINNSNGMCYIRCKVNDDGDFFDYEISKKLFGEYVKFDWVKINNLVSEVYKLYADGYYISKIYG